MTATNLLLETQKILRKHGKSPDDVRWVGNRQAGMGWSLFAEHADFTYDNGYGSEEISITLMVVGDDWWLERHGYDGKEWWEFKTLPKLPETNAADPDSIIRNI